MSRLIRTIAALCALTVSGTAQQPSAPAFEVASIKRNTSGSGATTVGAPADRFVMVNGTAMTLILNAYGLSAFRVIGAPGWMESERYDVTAKAGDTTTVEQRQRMLRRLLAERFKMVSHTESRLLPAYVLVLARTDRQLGPQLKPWTVDCDAVRQGTAKSAAPTAVTLPSVPLCGMRGAPGLLAAGGITMDAIAASLSSDLETSVSNETGLKGDYEVLLRWAPEGQPTDDRPSLFAAVQEQLGLKLESRRMPTDVLVIESIERPTPD